MHCLFLPNEIVARGATLLLVLVVASPVLQNWHKRPHDSFPLSYFPMFSETRQPEMKVTYLVGLDSAGNRHKVPYKFAGNGGLNQVRRQIAAKVRRGEAADLCGKIAKKLAGRDSPPYVDLVEVQVVSGRYSLSGYFTGDQSPRSEVVHASCSIKREKS